MQPEQMMEQFNLEEEDVNGEAIGDIMAKIQEVLDYTGNQKRAVFQGANIFFVGDKASFLQFEVDVQGMIRSDELQGFQDKGLGLPYVHHDYTGGDMLKLSFIEEVSKLIDIQYFLDLFLKGEKLTA
jgi:hypothetical protein